MNHKYVLVTPAKNEASFIEITINSVTNQTLQPTAWVIVDDNSIDNTAEIVKKYTKKHSFLHLITLKHSNKRNFASKVYAFNEGLRYLKNFEYNFIGNLDADVTMKPNYYEIILKYFSINRKLGIAGGVIYDKIDEEFIKQKTSRNSVAGAIQLFRRSCFEEIGGYMPMERGAEDAIAEITARKYGWETTSFEELRVDHFRRTGTATKNILKTRFNGGILEYSLGYGFIFHIIKSIYKIQERPVIIGSFLVMLGYAYAAVKGTDKIISTEVVDFLRKEQSHQLRLFIKGCKNRYFKSQTNKNSYLKF